MLHKDDTAQAALGRMAWLFNTDGLYVKANQCYAIIDYIDALEKELADIRGEQYVRLDRYEQPHE